MYMQSSKAKEAAALAMRGQEELEKANTEMKAEFSRIQEKLDRQLASAKSAEDIAKAKAEAEAARAAAEEKRAGRVKGIRRAAKASDSDAPKTKKIKVSDSDNPL
jgi:hypothetical protein